MILLSLHHLENDFVPVFARTISPTDTVILLGNAQPQIIISVHIITPPLSAIFLTIWNGEDTAIVRL